MLFDICKEMCEGFVRDASEEIEDIISFDNPDLDAAKDSLVDNVKNIHSIIKALREY